MAVRTLALLIALAIGATFLLSCSSKQNPLVEEALDRGDESFEAGRFAEAILEYTKAIEIDPENAVGYNNRGIAYYRSYKFEKAMADYDKAIDLDPDFVTAYINRGNAHANDPSCLLGCQPWEGYARAIPDYSEAIRLEPDNALFYYKRGVAYHFRDAGSLTTHDSDSFSEAIEDYNKAISIDPDFVDAYVNRGVAYYWNGVDNHRRGHERTIADFDMAISLLQDSYLAYRSQDIPPRSLGTAVEDISHIYFAKGVIHGRDGNMAAMKSDIEKAIELGFNPSLIFASEPGGYALLWMIVGEKDIPTFYQTRALERLSRADYDNAIADMDKARELIDPQFIHRYSDDMREVYFQSGVAYYDTGLYDQAIILFDKAIDLVASRSKNSAAYYQRGMSHYRKGSYRRAIADFDRLLGLEQDFPEAAHYRQLAQKELSE